MNRKQRRAFIKCLNKPEQVRKDINARIKANERAVKYNKDRGLFLKGQIFALSLLIYFLMLAFL